MNDLKNQGILLNDMKFFLIKMNFYKKIIHKLANEELRFTAPDT